MQDKQDKQDGRNLPMYSSYVTFTTFLDWLGEMPVMPTQLDRSLWGPKFAGGTGAQLLTGLRFLGLLIGDKPTPRLEPIVRARGEDRRLLITQLLKDAYGAETIDQLVSMTPKMLNEALAGLGTTESTHRKAFSFLVNAAKGNNVPIAPAIAKKARNKPAVKRTGASAAKKKPPEEGSENSDNTPAKHSPRYEQPQHSPNARTVKLNSGGEVVVSVSVDLFNLDKTDTEFVLSIIELLRRYESTQKSAEATKGENGEAPGLQSLAAAPGAPERSIDAVG